MPLCVSKNLVLTTNELMCEWTCYHCSSQTMHFLTNKKLKEP